VQHWWDTWPGRIEDEQQRLDAAGIRYERDHAAWQSGVLRYRVSAIGDQDVDLVATFPDTYPFFRPRVHLNAPEAAGLTHHIAPFGGDLCLLGRRTAAWTPKDTLAWLLTKQLPKTLRAGAPRDKNSDTAALDRLEEHQAEPVTEYYTCFADEAAVLVDGGWALSPDAQSGRMTVRFRHVNPAVAGGTLGAVARLEDDATGDETLFDTPGLAPFVHEVPARWVRLPTHVPVDDPEAIHTSALKRLGELGHTAPGTWERLRGIKDRQFQILGVVFPEERRHREPGDGWVFVVRVLPNPSPGKPPAKRRGSRPIGSQRAAPQTHLVRAAYAGRSDMAARVPEVAGLADKQVVVIGLGALGGTVAEQLARAGLGELTLLDRDRLEPGNLVRHCGLLTQAGRSKSNVVGEIAQNAGPYTKINSVQGIIGFPRANDDTSPPEQSILADLIRKADLVIDCTAEAGVHRMLSWLCSRRQKDLLVVSASNGGWGGRTVLLPARAGAPCWNCFELTVLDDETGPLVPPASPEDEKQPAGCADPTFTGTGFDLAEVSLQAVRVAVGTLLQDEPDGYPATDKAVHVLALRDASGAAALPTWTAHPLKVHPACGADHRST
jgi:molybdopterin/thiamine biosynthesis adenylyltransferase